jgi:site-specific recombinase XerD
MKRGEVKTTTLADGTKALQPTLVKPAHPGRGERGATTSPPVGDLRLDISASSSLAAGITWFEIQMEQRGYSVHTQRNYGKAMRLLLKCFGQSPRLGDINQGDVERFARYVRGLRRSAKTKEIAITAVRTFFRWLQAAAVIPLDPAAEVYADRVDPTPPRLLHDSQIDDLRKAAAEAASGQYPDPLYELLLCLMLDLGLRLGEVDRLQIDDIDRSIPLRPVVEICYNHRRHRSKERRLIAPPQLTSYVEAYLKRYPPKAEQTELVSQSRRTIQTYIADLGKVAGLRETLTANRLRWTYAATQWRDQIPGETMRARLGVSRKRWEYMSRKLDELTKRPV